MIHINCTFPPSQVHWCICADSLPSYAAGHDPVWDNLLGVFGILFRCFLFCASWWGEIYWCSSSCAILWKCFIWKWKQHDCYVFTKCNIHYKFEHLSLWNTVSQTGCHLLFVLCIWGEPKRAPLWWVYVCTRMLGLKMTKLLYYILNKEWDHCETGWSRYIHAHIVMVFTHAAHWYSNHVLTNEKFSTSPAEQLDMPINIPIPVVLIDAAECGSTTIKTSSLSNLDTGNETVDLPFQSGFEHEVWCWSYVGLTYVSTFWGGRCWWIQLVNNASQELECSFHSFWSLSPGGIQSFSYTVFVSFVRVPS